MMNAASVSQWISGIKQGESNSAQELWNRYAIQLVELARRKLGTAPRGIADEEDIAQNVFQSICRGAVAGRFNDVQNRDDLWWLLLGITKQKVVDHIRRETAKKRGEGRVRQESSFNHNANDSTGFNLCNLVSDEPTPEFVLMLHEQHEHLLGLLRNDQLRQIAMHRIEGLTVNEIADDLHVSNRSVERKLALIRDAWSKEFE